MAIQPNYLARGGDPYAGAAAINEDALTSIGTALFGNPQMAGQRALRTAQAEQIGLENERVRRGLEYGDRFGTDLAGVFTVRNPDGSTRPATFAEAAPRLGDLFKSAYWANGGDPTKTAGWLRAFTAMTGNEDLSRAGFVAAGGAPGQDYAATTGRAEEVRAANARNDKDRATAVAGIGAGATVRAAQIGQEGANTRQREQLAWQTQNPTTDQARARLIPGYVDDPLLDPATRGERQREILAPSVASAEERARGAEASARARGDAQVRAAQVRAESGALIAQLQATGRVSAADVAGYWRHQAAVEAGNARVDSADAAAAARVQAAVEAGNATRDAAATRAGAAKPAIAVPSAVSKAWDTEIDALEGEANFSVNDEGKLWLKQRAGELYQQQGPAQRNGTAAMRQAWEDYKAANPANTRGTIGGMFLSPRYGAPAATGSPQLVPARPDAPAAPAGIPPHPATVPPGSQYSPSRRMWRDPEGRTYTEDGRPAA